MGGKTQQEPLDTQGHSDAVHNLAEMDVKGVPLSEQDISSLHRLVRTEKISDKLNKPRYKRLGFFVNVLSCYYVIVICYLKSLDFSLRRKGKPRLWAQLGTSGRLCATFQPPPRPPPHQGKAALRRSPR